MRTDIVVVHLRSTAVVPLGVTLTNQEHISSRSSGSCVGCTSVSEQQMTEQRAQLVILTQLNMVVFTRKRTQLTRESSQRGGSSVFLASQRHLEVR